jgi:hypothetical protein
VRAAQVAFPRRPALRSCRGAAGWDGDLVAVTECACHREPVEPSAVAARRTRASLALAVVGAIALMTGVALALAGEGLRLERGAHPPSLIGPGLVLAFLGLVLGASAIVTIVLDAPTRLPATHPLGAARPAGRSAFGSPPAGPAAHGEVVAGEVLSSSRLPDPRPPAASGRTEVVPGAALSPPRGADPGYSDAGWGAGAGGTAWPGPPPEPPREIHHPGGR